MDFGDRSPVPISVSISSTGPKSETGPFSIPSRNSSRARCRSHSKSWDATSICSIVLLTDMAGLYQILKVLLFPCAAAKRTGTNRFSTYPA